METPLAANPGAELAPSAGTPAMLGRYELLIPIARGGMGVVWAARLRGPKAFRKLVAVKAMLPELSSDPRFDEMFAYEARIASSIKHPNVCEILDFGEQDGTLYIVMEWVDGEPLSALVSASRRLERAHAAGGDAPPPRLSVDVATRIGVEVARGLYAAHTLETGTGERLGLVHCDVSPPNILVTDDGLVKLVDFGLAKAAAEAAPAHDLVGGKMSYMAPEQAAGRPVDARTDVFSLGLVLYELVTKTHPFWAETSLATLQRIRDDMTPVTPPSELVRDCPVSVSAAIVRALQKDPDARFPDMRAFAWALQRGLADLATDGAANLGALVRATLGPRIASRRAAIRDAMRAAEERLTSAPPAAPLAAPSLPPSTELASGGLALPTDAPLSLPAFRPRSDKRVLAGLAVAGILGATWGLAHAVAPDAALQARTGVAAAAANASRLRLAPAPARALQTAPTPSGATPAADKVEPARSRAGVAAAPPPTSEPSTSAPPAPPAESNDTWKRVREPGF